MGSLQPRERRLLFVYLPVVAIGVLGYAYVVEPLMTRREEVQFQIQASDDLLSQRHQLIARRGRYATELRALQEELAARRARLLPGDKPPIAASELQKLVKSTAQETGVEVRSERILPTTERGAYTEVPVEVTLWGPTRSLVAFLHRLEETPILLGITDLRLRVTSVGAPREITATLAVAGYIATSTNGAVRSTRPEPGRPPAP